MKKNTPEEDQYKTEIIGFTRKVYNFFGDIREKFKINKAFKLWGSIFVFILINMFIFYWFGFNEFSYVIIGSSFFALCLYNLFDELFSVIMYLPFLIGFLIFWTCLSVAAVLDLIFLTKHLTKKSNRISSEVLGVNLPFVLLFIWNVLRR